MVFVIIVAIPECCFDASFSHSVTTFTETHESRTIFGESGKEPTFFFLGGGGGGGWVDFGHLSEGGSGSKWCKGVGLLKGVSKGKSLDLRSQEVGISVSYNFFTMFFSAISEYFGISLC